MEDAQEFAKLCIQENKILDNTLRADGVFIEARGDQDLGTHSETRYCIRGIKRREDGESEWYKPDARTLLQLTRAWNLKNELDEYHQPCTYILSAFLQVSKCPELAYSMMNALWHSFDHRKHFDEDFAFSNAVTKSFANKIEFLLPNLAEKLDQMRIFDACMQSFYIFIFPNFGFTGQECGLPFEIAARVFEFFVFNNDLDCQATVNLFIYMLQIREDLILEIEESEECFRYVGHGQFITDCLTDPNIFKTLV